MEEALSLIPDHEIKENKVFTLRRWYLLEKQLGDQFTYVTKYV